MHYVQAAVALSIYCSRAAPAVQLGQAQDYDTPSVLLLQSSLAVVSLALRHAMPLPLHSIGVSAVTPTTHPAAVKEGMSGTCAWYKGTA